MKQTLDYVFAIRAYEPRKTAAIRVKTTMDKVTPKVTQLLNETAEYLQSQGIAPAGHGFGIYYEVGTHGFLVDVEVGYPVDLEIPGNDRVHPGSLPGGKAVVVAYKGPHAKIGVAHQAAQTWMSERDIEFIDVARESFLTDLRGLGEDEDCVAESIWPIDPSTPTTGPQD